MGHHTVFTGTEVQQKSETSACSGLPHHASKSECQRIHTLASFPDKGTSGSHTAQKNCRRQGCLIVRSFKGDNLLHSANFAKGALSSARQESELSQRVTVKIWSLK